MFKLYAEGKGLKAITNQLNKAGYRNENGKNRNTNGI
ncbi:recombinase family protein [Fictibacillus nanhaiensis]|nr:recombinase family protein [Fictibacillus nanhaiensis]